MGYLNPNDPLDMKVILEDLIDQELEQIELTELYNLLKSRKEIIETKNIIRKNELIFVLDPNYQATEESVAYLLEFWQQIYFDYFVP
jgi:hypothetical protein